MMRNIIAAMKNSGEVPAFEANVEVVSCHHNYVTWEHHYGENVLITRKGAVRAREGDMGIIPGSMGARSYIVRGKGNPESFMSCSHGAGRAMSRAEAKRRFTLDDHAKATAGVECRKDADVIDETPMAYKSIDAVMEAQRDLVDIMHTLRQVVCVKDESSGAPNKKSRAQPLWPFFGSVQISSWYLRQRRWSRRSAQFQTAKG